RSPEGAVHEHKVSDEARRQPVELEPDLHTHAPAYEGCALDAELGQHGSDVLGVRTHPEVSGALAQDGPIESPVVPADDAEAPGQTLDVWPEGREGTA